MYLSLVAQEYSIFALIYVDAIMEVRKWKEVI